MAASNYFVLDDLDAYAAAIHAAGLLLAVDAERFEARLTRLDLDGLGLAEGRERMGRIAFLDIAADTLLIALPAVPRTALLWGGMPVGLDGMLTMGPGCAMHARTLGSCRWGEILISVPVLERYGWALRGRSFRAPRGVGLWQPSRPALTALVRLFVAAMKWVQSRPDGCLWAEAERGLKQELIEAVIDCLSESILHQNWPGLDLMVRFERLCQGSRDRALRLVEVTAALGSSERTLRAHCHTHLGMGPHAYMQLHRLHRVRRSLQNASPGSISIEQVARTHGFTELGRFASAYRAMCGELPSATLRRRAE